MSTKALDPVTDTVGDATKTAAGVVDGLTGSDGGKVNKKTPKKLSSSLQKTAPPQADQLDPAFADDDDDDGDDSFEQQPESTVMPKRSGGRRMVPVHQSRIADRPPKVNEKDSSLKIKIELDLEVEVEIYARVKGDVTIGLM